MQHPRFEAGRPPGEPQAKRVCMGNPLGLSEDEDQEQDELDMFDGPKFVQVGLPTRSVERNELGRAEGQSKCFGCIYFGETKTAALPRRRMDRLMNKLIKFIGQMDPITLCKETAREYQAIRQEVNRRLQPGERKLPPWTAATILQHLRTHHTDPSFHQWMRLRDVRELAEVALQASVQKDEQTGVMRVDKDQLKCYIDTVKLEQQLMKVKASDCAFFNEGKYLDAKSLSKGPVALTFKPIVDMLQRGNKR